MNTATNGAVGPTTPLTARLAKWLDGCYAEAMAYGEPLNVDISDLASIREALTRAEHEVVSRDVQVREAVEGLRYWQTMHHRLLSLASENGTHSSGAVGETVRQRLLRFVNESRVPVDVDQAQQLVPNAKRKTVSWTLWDLARKKEIQKITEGLYASHDLKPATLLDGERSRD
jgi:hypothetical protein